MIISDIETIRGWSERGEIVVVVDELVARPDAKIRCFRAGSCHLAANGYSELHLDALHKFAARIGMKRSYFQPHKIAPHYDLTKNRREAAIIAGAVEVSAYSFQFELRRLRAS
jgi:hypothetical protein